MGKSGTDGGREVESLIESQLREWDLAGNNYRDLAHVMVRTVRMESGCTIKIQFNPARMRSSAARVDKRSVESRPCFLCRENLPARQRGLGFGDRYLILVNPFPIFPRHLTIPLKDHVPQLIRGRFGDMLELSRYLKDFSVFYNGPLCGASAPDHFHFQAGSKGFMPVEEEAEIFERKPVAGDGTAVITTIEGYHRHTLVMEGTAAKPLVMWFEKIYDILQHLQGGDDEPMMNIIAGRHGGGWRVFLFPRRVHRPAQFFEEGDGQILLSPASVDFGGVWITPRREDYEKIGAADVTGIFDQVSLGKAHWAELLKRLAGCDD